MSANRKPREPRVLWLNKPPIYKRAWLYVWLLVLLGLVITGVFAGWHGYHFPCRTEDGGVYNCDADSATRWAAALRDGVWGTVCFAWCPILITLAAHVAWANVVRPVILRQKYERAGVPPEHYLQPRND